MLYFSSKPWYKEPTIHLILGSLLAIGLHSLLRIQNDGIQWHGYPVSDWPLLLAITIGGVPLIGNILKELIQRNFGVDLLAAIGILTALALNELLAATLLIIMLSGGELLEHYALSKASSVLEVLAQRMPHIAHRKEGAEIKDISINDILPGDEIIIYPHETCPVDGIVLEGHGHMDESYLTGEPYKISKGPGVKVISGAINGNSLLIIQASHTPKDSRYQQIVNILTESEQKKPHLRRLADQLGGYFTPLALFIAGLTWALTGEASRFLAVLVVATPCPLIIGIPITIVGAISLAAQRGIIVKDPTIFEQLPLCRTAIFDKTGTLTYGQAKLTSISLTPSCIWPENQILQWVASLECYSKHPLAAAVVKKAQQKGLVTLEADHVTETPGRGLQGIVKGHHIHITHRKKLAQMAPHLLEQLSFSIPGLECVIVVDNQVVATFQFRDALRTEGEEFIRHLGPNHAFEKIIIVSGDRASEVRQLASELGISEAYSEKTPEEKWDIVTQETTKSKTLYVGDGINDAPALTAATVGISMGTNAVLNAVGGAIIMESSLLKVDELFHISTLMRRISLQSAVGGIILSLIAMIMASYGLFSPVFGALLQEGIDLLAIFNALRMGLIANKLPLSDLLEDLPVAPLKIR